MTGCPEKIFPISFRTAEMVYFDKFSAPSQTPVIHYLTCVRGKQKFSTSAQARTTHKAWHRNAWWQKIPYRIVRIPDNITQAPSFSNIYTSCKQKLRFLRQGSCVFLSVSRSATLSIRILLGLFGVPQMDLNGPISNNFRIL